ncbi:hypothetical protein [Spiroplasma kunkelii]|nr:hypothetical protein [Spiroplasma kunkelii]
MTKNKDKLIAKLEELMLRPYSVSADKITDEYWVLPEKKLEWKRMKIN